MGGDEIFFEKALSRIRWLFPYFGSIGKGFTIKNSQGTTIEFHIRVLDDLDWNVRHVFIITKEFGHSIDFVEAISGAIPSLIDEVVGKKVIVGYWRDDSNNQTFTNDRIIFSGQVNVITDQVKGDLKIMNDYFNKFGLKLMIRDEQYWQQMIKNRKFDLFISYSRKNKDIVNELAVKLQNRFLKIWFDEDVLIPGDSLLSEIGEGLKKCDFGLMFISKEYIENKTWAKKEIRNLLTREIHKNENIIIPLWYKVDAEDIYKFSLDVLDKLAITVNADTEIDKVADLIQKTILRKQKISEILNLEDLKP